MRLALITVNYNGGEKIVELVKKLRHYLALSQVIVVDNSSTDDSFIKLQKIDDESRKIKTIGNKTNRGFAAAVNQGAKLAFKNKRGLKDYFRTKKG